MHKKTKGSIAELHICANLMKQGWNVLIPYGENNRYDLVVEKKGKFIRIQAKYVTPKDGKLYVNCRSSNNWSVLHYTPNQIDVIAVFNPKQGRVYYVPVGKIRKSAMILRLEPPKNKQKAKIRYAREFDGFVVKDARLFVDLY